MNGIGNSNLENLLQVFFIRSHSVIDWVKKLIYVFRGRSLLDLLKLLLAQNSFSDIEAIHIAPVTEVTEFKVQVVAIEAEPIADPLSQNPL